MMALHTFIAVLFWSITLCQTYSHKLCTDASLVDGLMRVCLRSLPDDDVIIDWYRNRMKQSKEYHHHDDDQGQNGATDAATATTSTSQTDSEITSFEATALPAIRGVETISATSQYHSEFRKFIDNLRHLLNVASYSLDHHSSYADVEDQHKNKDLLDENYKELQDNNHKDLHDDNYKDLRHDIDTGSSENDHNHPSEPNRKAISVELQDDNSYVGQKNQIESMKSLPSRPANANDSRSNDNQHISQELSSFRRLDMLATKLARNPTVRQLEKNTGHETSFISNQRFDYDTDTAGKPKSIDYSKPGSDDSRDSWRHEINEKESVNSSNPSLGSPYMDSNIVVQTNKPENPKKMIKESNDFLELLSRYHRRVPRSSPADDRYSNTELNVQESQEKRASNKDLQPTLRDIILQIKIKQMKQLLNSISTVASQSSNRLLDKFSQFYRVKKYVAEKLSLPTKTKKSFVDDETDSDDEIEIISDQLQDTNHRFNAEEELLALDHAPGSEARVSKIERQIENNNNDNKYFRSISSSGDDIGDVDYSNPHLAKKSIDRAAQNLLAYCCIRGCSDSDLISFCHG